MYHKDLRNTPSRQQLLINRNDSFLAIPWTPRRQKRIARVPAPLRSTHIQPAHPNTRMRHTHAHKHKRAIAKVGRTRQPTTRSQQANARFYYALTLMCDIDKTHAIANCVTALSTHSIPRRQGQACSGVDIRNIAWHSSTSTSIPKSLPLVGANTMCYGVHTVKWLHVNHARRLCMAVRVLSHWRVRARRELRECVGLAFARAVACVGMRESWQHACERRLKRTRGGC